MLAAALLACSGTGAAAFRPGPSAAAVPAGGERDQEKEARLLPSASGVKWVSVGYGNVAADLLWFKTIDYFGAHIKRDGDLRWLAHMCGLVVTLDPAAKHVYGFCANMLSWEYRSHREAESLLGRGIARFPDDWYLYYLRGFVRMYFRKAMPEAKDDFIAASRLPDVHPVVVGLASSTVEELEGEDRARSLLEGLVSATDDPEVKRTVRDRLRKLDAAAGRGGESGGGRR